MPPHFWAMKKTQRLM